MNNKLLKYVKSKFINISKDLMENPQGLKFKLEKASEKVNTQSVRDSLGKNIEDLKTLIRMAKAWSSRRYRKVSTQTIVYTIAAIIYFVTPTDFMPDFVLGLGFLDDIAVIRWVIGHIKDDLENFKAWEEGKKTAAGKAKAREKNGAESNGKTIHKSKKNNKANTEGE